MRIGSGKYKNKKILSHEDENLRPSTSRTRETIFNLLKHGRFMAHEDFIADENDSRLVGRKVLDLFAGTGALGLEALSNGAAHVVFVDKDRRRVDLLNKNIENIADEDAALVINSDSTNIPDAKYYSNAAPVDLVFLDPPYNQNLSRKAVEDIKNKGWLASGAIIIIEHAKNIEPDLKGLSFKVLDTRKQGRTTLTIAQYNAN